MPDSSLIYRGPLGDYKLLRLFGSKVLPRVLGKVGLGRVYESEVDYAFQAMKTRE